MNEKISVIIPIYNAEKYIDKCLNSVISQTYKKIEIICVNDGSTDRTSERLNQYAETDRRIVVVHQENKGLAATRKTGLKYASGDYIAFLDSDDWIEPSMYETMYNWIVSKETDAVCTALYMVKGKHKTVSGSFIEEGIYNNEQIRQCLYDIENCRPILNIGYGSYLLKKEKIIPYVNMVDDSVEQGEDLVGIWGFLVNADSIYVNDTPFYNYRIRSDSSSHKENPDYLISISKAYKILKEEFNKTRYSAELIKILKHAIFDFIQDNTVLYSEKQPFFMFPYEKIDRNRKIIIYGAGLVGKSFYRQMCVNKYCEVVLWADREYESIRTVKYPVKDPALIQTMEFDYIVIAAVNMKISDKISMFLQEEYNILPEKIVVSKARRMSKFVEI